MSTTTATQTSPSSFRDMLYGDTPLDNWGAKATGEPWSWFAQARNALQKGDKPAAIASLQRIVETPDLESRHYLVAWHALRQLGVNPPAGEAKRLLGVIVEMPVDHAFDILACYEDDTARYMNHSGGIIIVESPMPQITEPARGVLQASRPVVARIGPHNGPRPELPDLSQMRLSFLTPSGLHFGQGDVDVFMRDPMAGPVIAAAITLLQAVIGLTAK